MRFSTYRADLVQRPLSYEMVLREKVITGTPEMVVERLRELRETAPRWSIGRGQPAAWSAMSK